MEILLEQLLYYELHPQTTRLGVPFEFSTYCLLFDASPESV